MPLWLEILSIVWLVGGFAAAIGVAATLWRYPPQMAIMAPVWIVTPLYFGAPGYFLYDNLGRSRAKKSFEAEVLLSTLHCGAGCTLGDIVAECALYAAGIENFYATLAADFSLAFLFGIVFQYFSIVPMRNLKPLEGIVAALKADALSLISFEIGLFAWMAVTRYILFPSIDQASPTFWFMMQIGMLIGLATSYPVNIYLLKAGIKHAM